MRKNKLYWTLINWQNGRFSSRADKNIAKAISFLRQICMYRAFDKKVITTTLSLLLAVKKCTFLSTGYESWILMFLSNKLCPKKLRYINLVAFCQFTYKFLKITPTFEGELVYNLIWAFEKRQNSIFKIIVHNLNTYWNRKQWKVTKFFSFSLPWFSLNG